MLVGDLGIWLYENLAGIKSDPEQPGFKHIVMRPEPVGDLQFVKASHRSPYGLIASDWQKKDGVFRWNITVPANTGNGLCAGEERGERHGEWQARIAGAGGEAGEDGEWPGGLFSRVGELPLREPVSQVRLASLGQIVALFRHAWWL